MYVNRLFLKKINRDFICIFIIYLSQKLQLARKIKYFVKSVSKTTHWHLIGKGNTTERSHEPILLPSSTFFLYFLHFFPPSDRSCSNWFPAIHKLWSEIWFLLFRWEGRWTKFLLWYVSLVILFLSRNIFSTSAFARNGMVSRSILLSFILTRIYSISGTWFNHLIIFLVVTEDVFQHNRFLFVSINVPSPSRSGLYFIHIL